MFFLLLFTMFSMFRPASVVRAVIWLIMPGSFLWMMQMRLPPALGWLTSGMFTEWIMLPFFR